MALFCCSVDKKNYHRRYHETYENSSGYYGGDYSTHLGRGSERGGNRDRASPSAHSDTRYTDMAPKYVLVRYGVVLSCASPRFPPLEAV